MLRGLEGEGTGESRLEKRRRLEGNPGVMPGSREFLWGRQHRLAQWQGMSREQSQGHGRALLCFALLGQDPKEDLPLAPDAPESELGLRCCARSLGTSPRAAARLWGLEGGDAGKPPQTLSAGP